MKTKIVVRCGHCGRIKVFIFWIRLNEKQNEEFFDKVNRGEIQILYDRCNKH